MKVGRHFRGRSSRNPTGRAIPMDSGTVKRSAQGGSRKWSEEKRRSWKVWRNYWPSPTYARGDPHTFLVPIDEAAHIADLSAQVLFPLLAQWQVAVRSEALVPRAQAAAEILHPAPRPDGAFGPRAVGGCQAAAPAPPPPDRLSSRAKLLRLHWSGNSNNGQEISTTRQSALG